MAPKRAEIEGWEADVIALQETRLGTLGQITTGAKLREQNWQAFFGKPMANKVTKNKVATATNAANGGVAILAKEGTPVKKAQNSAETAILRDQGRWEEILHALGKGNKHLKVASLYGYDGAPTDGERFRLNEDLISRALIRLLEAGDTPYLICGDFNISPQQSPAIAGLIAKGLLIDVPHAFGLGGQHTFCHHAKGPPKEGIEEKGRTRIDTILANKAAFPLITECKCRWDILLSDHVPIEVVLDLQKYGAERKGG
jgi:exonuclease III